MKGKNVMRDLIDFFITRNFRDGHLNLLEKNLFSREKVFAFSKLSMVSRKFLPLKYLG